jgi:hypothetical protein
MFSFHARGWFFMDKTHSVFLSLEKDMIPATFIIFSQLF